MLIAQEQSVMKVKQAQLSHIQGPQMKTEAEQLSWEQTPKLIQRSHAGWGKH